MQAYEVTMHASFDSNGNLNWDENANLGCFLFLSREIAQRVADAKGMHYDVKAVPILDTFPPSPPIIGTVTEGDLWISFLNVFTAFVAATDGGIKDVNTKTFYSLVQFQKDTGDPYMGKQYKEIGLLQIPPFGGQIPSNPFGLSVLERKVVTNTAQDIPSSSTASTSRSMPPIIAQILG